MEGNAFSTPMTLRDLFSAGISPRKSGAKTLEKAGIFLLLIYLMAGIIYSAILAPTARFPDERDYLALSHNLIAGPGFSLDGVHLTASRPPGYPFFLAVIRTVGGDFFSFRVTQFLLLTVTIFFLHRLCSEKKMFAGLFITTCLVMCYPVLFYTSGTLYPQTVSEFLFVIALTFMLIEPKSLALSLVTGVIFGVLILVVPTFLMTLVITLGAAGLLGIIRFRDGIPIVLAALLIVGVWTGRNAICFHHFVPVASNSGLTFLMGNNKKAVADEGVANAGMDPYYREAERQGLDEFQSDHFYQQAAMGWIKAHPGDAVILYLEKVLNYFNAINVYAPGSHEEVSFGKQVMMASSYLLLLGLLGWRLGDARRFPLVPREKLFLAIYVLSAFTSAIFVTRIRYRLPYDLLIIAVIGFYLSRRFEIWANGIKSDCSRDD
jgi:hypothetical protein